MSKVIKLTKGLDIKLNGKAEKVVQPQGTITRCALKPTDFRALVPTRKSNSPLPSVERWKKSNAENGVNYWRSL